MIRSGGGKDVGLGCLCCIVLFVRVCFCFDCQPAPSSKIFFLKASPMFQSINLLLSPFMILPDMNVDALNHVLN